jgi:hypothetical protein
VTGGQGVVDGRGEQMLRGRPVVHRDGTDPDTPGHVGGRAEGVGAAVEAEHHSRRIVTRSLDGDDRYATEPARRGRDVFGQRHGRDLRKPVAHVRIEQRLPCPAHV